MNTYNNGAMPILGFAFGELRLSSVDDWEQVLRYEAANRAAFEIWEPPSSIIDQASCERALAASITSWQNHSSLNLYIYHPGGSIIGHVCLLRIVREARHHAQICFGLDQDWQSRGIMTAALAAVVTFAFQEMGLHRIEAHVMPTNLRSTTLVKRLGFVAEGLLREAIQVQGQWVPLELYALLAHEHRQQ